MENMTDIIWLDRVKSTNDEARRHISEIDNLSVLSALEQTDGRGQHGNKWSSQPGENLTFSIVIKDLRIKSNEQSAISQVTALSLTDFLESHEISAKIKWPNDVVVNSKKVCGISHRLFYVLDDFLYLTGVTPFIFLKTAAKYELSLYPHRVATLVISISVSVRSCAASVILTPAR